MTGLLMTRSASSVAAAGALAALLLGAGACGSPGTDTAATAPSTTAATGTPGTLQSSTTTTAAIATTTTTIDPGTLPQTDEKPAASGAQWDADTHALWDAIVSDDPAKAMSFFFPLSAYTQVKGISDPKHDYDTRLIPYYEEDIHALHKQLGANAAKAQFVAVEVPGTAQWIKPGVEYNKGAYWRVQENKLRYTVDGAPKSFVVKSMISWRGRWYVVHLTSIR
jgi:hypothetical protein